MNISVIITNTNLSGYINPYIKNRPLLERQCDLINKRFDNADIIYVGEDKPEVCSNLRTVSSKYGTNTAYSIRLGLKKCKYRKVLIISAESMFNLHTLNIEYNKVCKIIISNEESSYIGCSSTEGKLNNLFFGLPYSWSGILYVAGSNVSKLSELCSNKKIFAFEAVNDLLNYTDIETVLPKRSKSLYLYTKQDIEKANTIKWT